MQVTKTSAVVPIFFVALLVIGLFAYDDYGISWDEPVQREYGAKVYNFLTSHDEELFRDRHRYYGPVVESFLYWLEQILSLRDIRKVYLMRHLATFLISWIGLIFLYKLTKRLIADWRIALLSPILLFMSPRILAHGFYNTKDIPFMVVFVVGIYSLVHFLEKRSLRSAILHGFICALLLDIRIIGILIVVITLIATLLALLSDYRSQSLGRAISSLGTYLGSLIGLTIIMWPTLWRHPLSNFVHSFEVMRSFPWEAPVLFLGREVWSTNLPWYYLPVWIGVSSPPIVIALGTIGFILLAWKIASRQEPGLIRISALVILLWFWVPLSYLMFARVVLYDAWRHAFFIYPAMVLASVFTIERIVTWIPSGKRLLRTSLIGLLASALIINLTAITFFVIRNHPHENVYFNALTHGVRGAQGKFELDYWGLSYRQGLEWIAANDSADQILIHAATAPGRYNAYILKAPDRRRLIFVANPNAAQYYITNFRWERGKPRGKELYTIRVDGARILSVFGR